MYLSSKLEIDLYLERLLGWEQMHVGDARPKLDVIQYNIDLPRAFAYKREPKVILEVAPVVVRDLPKGTDYPGNFLQSVSSKNGQNPTKSCVVYAHLAPIVVPFLGNGQQTTVCNGLLLVVDVLS